MNKSKVILKNPTWFLTISLIITISTILYFVAIGWELYNREKQLLITQASINRMSEQIIYLDEVLTMSARLNAVTGEKFWENRYNKYEPKLNFILTKVISLSSSLSAKRFISETENSNNALVAMERQSFMEVHEGRLKQAKDILFSDEYENHKSIYANGISRFLEDNKFEIEKNVKDSERRMVNYLLIAIVIILVSWTIVFFIFWGHFSKRNKIENKLIESTEKLRLILDASGDGIYGLDLNGQTTFANPAAEKMLGYPFKEMLNQSQHALIHHTKQDGTPYHPEKCPVFATISENKVQHISDEVFWKKDGTSFPVEYISTPIVANGETKGAVVSFQNISDRKKAEKELEKAKIEAESANYTKSIFLANMSHEIRTPLNAILGYAQILLREQNLNQRQIEALKTINASGSSLLKMINDILDISKIEAGKQEINAISFDLKELTEEISKMFELRCRQKQLGWNVEGVNEKHFVLGDEAKLKAILVNLIGNAVKFTESGIVSLKISSLEKDCYLFEVTDTGIGISEKNQSYIFEPFNQEISGAKQGGTGLGLPISNKQLELMGSELRLKSELNKGSNFYFTLFLPPTSEDNVRQIEQNRNILCLAKGYRVKALVVDDVKENRDILSLILSDLKIEVVEAVDGKDGLEKVRKHIPDIIFMDLRMPVMNGKETILAIQKEFGKDRFKIVVVTASVFEHQREDYRKLGCGGFIIKPFHVEQIYKSLQELLGVEFEYVNEEGRKINASDIDFSNICIPETLYKNFSQSIAIGNIAMIDKYMEELGQINDNCEQLKELFIQYLKNYDTESIKQALEKLNISSSS